MDMDDSPVDENEQDDDRLDVAASLKSFHLLNALSDLLMLPKDMLLESSIRKEVRPSSKQSFLCLLVSLLNLSMFPSNRFARHSVHQ